MPPPSPIPVRLPPALAARFRIVEPLGEGGFGQVFRCEDLDLGRPVALKLMGQRLDSEALRRSFQREAEVTATVLHPHVVTLYDFGVLPDGMPYIFYELIEGQDLGAVYQDQAPSYDDLVTMAVAVAEALQAAHERGIVHRDVKPENLLLRGPGDPVLADFGIAHIGDDGTQVTTEGLILGTPAYMAPELWGGVAPSAASDQFAWAASFLKLGSRTSIYGGRSPGELMRAGPAGPNPALPAELSARLGGLAAVLRRALAASPQARFPTMAEAAAAARATAGDAPCSIPSPQRPRPSSTTLRVATTVVSPGDQGASHSPVTAQLQRPPQRPGPGKIFGLGVGALLGLGGLWFVFGPGSAPEVEPPPPGPSPSAAENESAFSTGLLAAKAAETQARLRDELTPLFSVAARTSFELGRLMRTSNQRYQILATLKGHTSTTSDYSHWDRQAINERYQKTSRTLELFLCRLDALPLEEHPRLALLGLDPALFLDVLWRDPRVEEGEHETSPCLVATRSRLDRYMAVITTQVLRAEQPEGLSPWMQGLFSILHHVPDSGLISFEDRRETLTALQHHVGPLDLQGRLALEFWGHLTLEWARTLYRYAEHPDAEVLRGLRTSLSHFLALAPRDPALSRYLVDQLTALPARNVLTEVPAMAPVSAQLEALLARLAPAATVGGRRRRRPPLPRPSSETRAAPPAPRD